MMAQTTQPPMNPALARVLYSSGLLGILVSIELLTCWFIALWTPAWAIPLVFGLPILVGLLVVLFDLVIYLRSHSEDLWTRLKMLGLTALNILYTGILAVFYCMVLPA